MPSGGEGDEGEVTDFEIVNADVMAWCAEEHEPYHAAPVEPVAEQLQMEAIT